MKEIAIVPRSVCEPGIELFAAITCLRSGGIHPRRAEVEKAFALVWVDDEEISIGERLLKTNGFEAAAVNRTDEL
jgi:hypothetical protein